jgi:hypothetical protein
MLLAYQGYETVKLALDQKNFFVTYLNICRSEKYLGQMF